MARIRKDYLDPRSPKNVQKINNDLLDIHNIMVSNINEVLHRGEKLDLMQNRSSRLLEESKKFDKYAKYANLQALWKSWAPVVAITLILIVFIYLRFFR
jgi:vesicle transport protein SEC22